MANLERMVFNVVLKIIFKKLHIFATLYHALFGTRATENQMNSLSNLKAYKDRHTTGVMFDAWMRMTV